MISTRRLEQNLAECDRIARKWIAQYEGLLATTDIEAVELTGELDRDGSRCSVAVQSYLFQKKNRECQLSV